MICGIGIDVVDVGRIRRADARWGDRFLKRVFTDRELTHCLAKKDPYPHLAGRFAAKEAAIKALSGLSAESGPPGRVAGHRGLQPDRVAFRDIEILNHPTGQPFITLGAGALEAAGNVVIHLSISHEQDVAVATVVLEKRL